MSLNASIMNELKRGQCSVCENRKKCSKRCSLCMNFVCGEHLEIYCKSCDKYEDNAIIWNSK